MQYPSSSTHSIPSTSYSPSAGLSRENPIVVECHSNERVERWSPEAGFDADLEYLLLMDALESIPPIYAPSAEEFLNEILSMGGSSSRYTFDAIAPAAQTPEAATYSAGPAFSAFYADVAPAPTPVPATFEATVPTFNVPGPRYDPIPPLATSVDDVTPSPLYAPYSGDALTPADPVPNTASAAGLSGAQRAQSRSWQGLAQGLPQQRFASNAEGHAPGLVNGVPPHMLSLSGGSADWVLPQQPAAAYAAPQTNGGVANGSLLRHEHPLSLPAYAALGPDGPAPSQPSASSATPMNARALQASGSGILNIPQQPAHSFPFTSSQESSHAKKAKVPTAQPREAGQRAASEAPVQEQPTAGASTSKQHLFEQAGHGVESPVTSTTPGVYAAPLPKTLYVQGPPDVLQGPPPAFKDIIEAMSRRELVTVAFPSMDSQIVHGSGNRTTTLTPRESVFLSPDSQPLDQSLRCKMCPGVSMQCHNFARHCRATAKHPTTLFFCRRCWEPFPREEACRTHFNNQEGSKACVALSKEDGKRRLEFEMGLLCAYEAFLIPRLLRGQVGLEAYKQWVKKARVKLQVPVQTGSQ
ncbi:hypothetical protein BC834DRAFT_846067 [Gloeopeniophorella convolvens]|nr:hypothetical protein BC834DRAFT_846067 [Gloeopeniophorella convolvens]